MIEKKIEDKQKEIEHYKGVLQRYGSGRWLNQGLRHLKQLETELSELYNDLEANKD